MLKSIKKLEEVGVEKLRVMFDYACPRCKELKTFCCDVINVKVKHTCLCGKRINYKLQIKTIEKGFMTRIKIVPQKRKKVSK